MSDPFDGDRPIFYPKCPKCGRFYGGNVTFWANGFGEIVRTEASCSRCGTISPHVTHWQSDVDYLRGGA